ncbi:MAG: transposase, partial [Succinivibrio sp.]|nr:transposase [Succinivibrio sp.]
MIRTNIPKDRLCAKQIYLLYRIRWTIELFNKANKQSSCLQSINSANKNII